MTAPSVAVGAIVVHDGSLLLVRRGRGVAVGKWSIPGGHVRFGESLHEAVVREVREETGLDVEVESFAGWVERRGSDPAPYHHVILDFHAALRPAGAAGSPALAAGDDAADARWVPLAEVAGLDLVDGLLAFLTDVGSVAP